jgi:hypothetical protein
VLLFILFHFVSLEGGKGKGRDASDIPFVDDEEGGSML